MAQTAAERSAGVKSLHDKRREGGLCIYDARWLGRPPHGKPHKGGRCFECWERKLKSAKRQQPAGGGA